MRIRRAIADFKHRFYSRLLISGIAFFIYSTSILPQPAMQNYNIRQGLPSNQVLFTFKDSMGFIWIASDKGLCRYDGDRFKTFKDEFDLSGLKRERLFVQITQYTKDSLLLVSATGKIFVYDYSKGLFSILKTSKEYLEEKYITGVFKANNGGYWFTTDRGIIKTDNRFNLIDEFLIKDKVQGPDNSNMINSLFEDKNGNLWLAMFYRGIFLFNPKSKEFSQRKLKGMISNIQVKQITGNQNNDYVYAATNGEGVIKINIHNYKFKKYKFGNSSIPSDQVNSIALFKDTVLYVGTRDGIGVLILDSEEFELIQHNDDKPNSLINNYVHHLMIDNQNIIWISTFGGLSKCVIKNKRFSKISYKPNSDSSPSSNIINFIYPDKSNNIWFGTSKGINIRAKNGEIFFRYLLPKDTPLRENEEMVRLYEDNNGYIWIGTWGGGISRTYVSRGFKAGESLVFRNFYSDTSKSNSLSSNFIRYITEDKRGNILISTWNGGLNIISARKKYLDKIDFIRIRKDSRNRNGIASDYLSEIVIDKADNIWIVTGNGLQRLNIEQNKSKMFSFDTIDSESALNSPSTLFKSQDNKIWLGTFGGLIKISSIEKENPNYEVIFKDENRGIYSILEDNNGKIWFSTLNSEIGMYNPKTNNLRFYNMIEEVNGFDFYFGYPYIDNKNNAYFNGNSGCLIFNTNEFSVNTFKPNLFISSIKIDGINITTDTDISRVDKIELNYEQKFISIRFSALSFINSGFNKYKYMLEKHDNHWYQLEYGNELNFSNLAYGEYILKIIGSNNDGVWNYKPTYLKIIINPPLWGTIYFRVASIICLLGLISFFFNKKIKKLKEERERQNYFSKLLIESQEEERKRLSKELHDSLGQNLLVAKNWLLLYKNSETKDEDELDKITELVGDSISEVREISSNLHPHQLERLGLNKAIISMVKKLTEKSSLNIDTQLDEIQGKLTKDQEINIFRIIQESLNNILKHSKASEASVVLSMKDNTCKLRIMDNGIGFPVERTTDSVTSFEGLGLHSIRERAKLINANLVILSDEKGTNIEMELKL